MIETRKDDAESIVGKELSDTLEQKSLVQSDALVIKSEEVATPASGVGTDHTNAVVEEAKPSPDPQSEDKWDEKDEDERERRRNMPESERSLLEKSFDALQSKITELKSANVPAETALKEIQPVFAALGEEVKKSFTVEPAAPSGNPEIAELTAAVKSLAESVATIQQSFAQEVATLKAQVTQQKSVVDKGGVPAPRSMSASAVPAQQSAKPLSISEIALRSTIGQR